ncbi:MAG: twitching motility protein PilT [Candidatus Thermoplasmatota archaeon]|nr:twitching motility protein PilT [Candidatus Thermoplasmatota archaeon]
MDKVLVLLDANALMIPFQFSVDLEGELARLLGEYEAVVPSSVLKELEGLSKSGGKAKAALRLAKRYRSLHVQGAGDDALLAAARKRSAAVLTNDRDLRRRLREADLPVIFLRGRSRLEAEGIPLR